MLILEKIIGETAVIMDNGSPVTVPKDMVRGCSVGDVLIMRDGCYITDKAATDERRKGIVSLQNSLWDD